MRPEDGGLQLPCHTVIYNRATENGIKLSMVPEELRRSTVRRTEPRVRQALPGGGASLGINTRKGQDCDNTPSGSSLSPFSEATPGLLAELCQQRHIK